VYSQWKDTTIPRRATLIKLADYFNVAVEDLLQDDPALQQQKKPALNEDELDSKEQEILTLLRAVPEDRREEAERAVMALIAGLKDRL
jgi:transcriptional regulator with XRE-family HTH domain